MKGTFILLLGLVLILSCETRTNKKIKLATFQSQTAETSVTASSVLRVLPEEQHSIAILHFHNLTGDPALDWLERGLADMFVTELSQSPYLNIIGMSKLSEMAGNLNFAEKDLFDPNIALQVARNAESDLLLSGSFYQKSDSMFIDVLLRDSRSAEYIRREVVHGVGMERLFAMVDELSNRVRTNIRGDLAGISADQIDLAEMTTSVEAFRFYSEGLENREKFFMAEAEKSFETAVKMDTAFSAAYLRLAELKLSHGKNEESKKAFEKAKINQQKLSIADKIYLELFETRLDYSYQKYLAKLQEAINKLPSNTDFHVEIGRIYREMGDYKSGLQHFEIVRDLEPNRRTIYNELAYLHALMGDFNTALDYIQKYKKLAMGEPNPYDSCGEILMWAGRPQEAIEQLEIALQISPTFFYSAERLGRIYTDLGQYEKGFDYFKLAAQNAPYTKSELSLEWRRALTHWRAGSLQKAIAELDNFDNKTDYQLPHKLNVLLTKAEIYNSFDKHKEAEQLFAEGLDYIAKQLEMKDLSADKINSINHFILCCNSDPEKSLYLTNQLYESTQIAASKTVVGFVGMLSALRANNPESAKEYFKSDFNDLVDLIAQDGKTRWSHTWKWLFELMASGQNVLPLPDIIQQLGESSVKHQRADLELIAQYLQLIDLSRKGKETDLYALGQNIGTPPEEKWAVSGPYFIKNDFAFNYAFPAEIPANQSEKKKETKIQWQSAHDGLVDGYIDLKKNLKKSSWATGYGLIYVHSPESQTAQIRIGSDEGFKLWLNDKLIQAQYLDMESEPDHSIVKVMFHPGYNKIMLKVLNRTNEWGFHFRITDENDQGLATITFHSPNEIDQLLAQK